MLRARRPPELTRPLLRKMDQCAVAGLVALALASMGGYWFVEGGATGRLIEIDRAPPQTAAFTLDVNEADWPEIAQLPGIGETLAKRIVESRDSRGRFADIDQLDRVRGIGPRTLQRIKPFLRPIAPTGEVAGQ